MADVGQVKLEDSNIAGIGSDMDKELRKLAAGKEEDFKNAGKTVGTEVWRIEKFDAVRIPVKQYGSFYSGDSYIVLETYKEGDALRYNLFYWLGKDSTQDERGSAAYLTVNLDDLLNQLPVQYRETQGNESDLFKKLFPHLMFLNGGVDSGFKKVAPEVYIPRLFRIAGRKPTVVEQVPFKGSSLNNGDVFILDAGTKLFQICPDNCNPFEKYDAAQLAQVIEAEREGLCGNTILVEGDKAILENDEIWEILKGKKPKSLSAKTEERAAPVESIKALWKINFDEKKGAFEYIKVAEGDDINAGHLTGTQGFIMALVVSPKEVVMKGGSELSVREKITLSFFASDILEGIGAKNARATIIKGNQKNEHWDKTFA